MLQVTSCATAVGTLGLCSVTVYDPVPALAGTEIATVMSYVVPDVYLPKEKKNVEHTAG